MDLPADLELPFFSYGLFQPGQIGFGRLQPFVREAERGWTTPGRLLERDGLPILDRGTEQIAGCLIRFEPRHAAEAYTAINSIEPDKLYVWKVGKVCRDGREEDTNILFGRKPSRGSIHPEYKTWDGSKEPLFTTAMVVVRETLERNKDFDWNLEPFFRLQMAYLLLWCAIERFVSFKYHLGNRVTEKVFKLAEDPTFLGALREAVTERREVFRSDDPEKKEILDRDDPQKALAYFYQVRSNITHRGRRPSVTTRCSSARSRSFSPYSSRSSGPNSRRAMSIPSETGRGIRDRLWG